MATIGKKGVFEAQVIDAEIAPAPSGAVMANFEFQIVREYDKASKQYSETWPEGWTVKGNVCLVMRSAEVMKDNVQRVAKSMGWDGNVNTIGNCIGSLCKVTVDSEEYPKGSGKYQFKAKYIDPAGEVDVSEINDRFGAMFQAFAAEVGPITPATAPANPPATQPAPATPPPAPAAEPAPFADTPTAEDKVPF